MSRKGLGSGWAWGVGLAAALISVWAVLDLVDATREEAARGAATPVAAEMARSPLNAIDLHRLLPDATDDLGTLVRVDGTVAAVVGDGFWVRDLRDNVVFVRRRDGRRERRDDELKAGAAVTVLGVIGLVPPGDAPPVDVTALPVPPSAVVIRDIRIEPIERGVAVVGR